MRRSLLDDLPRREPRYHFALTPLADAMFQLLIFFMVSSGLASFSTLTMASAPEEAAAQQVPDASIATAPTEPLPETILWTVDRESVTVRGQAFGPQALPQLTNALAQSDTPPNVVLIVRPTARVQDLAQVMEALQSAEITGVQIARGGGL